MRAPKTIKITVKVPEAEWEAMNQKRFATKTTFQTVGLDLFQGWLYGTRHEPGTGTDSPQTGAGKSPLAPSPPSGADLPPGHRKYVGMLIGVLRSGDRIAFQVVTGTLQAFSRDKGDGGRRKEKPDSS